MYQNGFLKVTDFEFEDPDDCRDGFGFRIAKSTGYSAPFFKL
jgi:hypothetical protein